MAAALVALAVGAAAGAQGDEPRIVHVFAERYDAFPAAVQMRNRTLVIAFRTGAGHIGDDGKIMVARSRDGGKTWSPSLAVDAPGIDDRTSDGLTQLRDGTLILTFFQLVWAPDHSSNEARGFFVTSRSGGRTWSRAQPVTIRRSPWVALYGRIVELRDRTLLQPAYILDNDELVSVLLQSKNRGKSWSVRSTLARAHNETSVLPLTQRRFLAFMRGSHSVPWISQVVSRDAGKTWSAPRRIFPEGASPDALRLKNGHLLLCVSDRTANPGVRCHVSADAKAWSAGKLIKRGTNADMGYPSSVQLGDGSIFTAYYNDAWHIDAAIYRERFLRD